MSSQSKGQLKAPAVGAVGQPLLNDVAPANIDTLVVTEAGFQSLRFLLNDVAPANMPPREVTERTFQLRL